jgi:hypothetical protein
MVDSLKLNKVLPSLSSAPKVKRTDQRKGNDPQNPFEEVFKKKRRKKKKKDDSELASSPDGDNSAGDEHSARYATRKDADEEEKSTDPSLNRIIDIRV